MKNIIIIISFVLLTILPLKDSYAWMRDADIANSKDSLRIGVYPDLALGYEKIIDKETTLGISYWPLPFGGYLFKEIWSLTYNKSAIVMESNSLAFSYGLMYLQLESADIEYYDLLNDKFHYKYSWQVALLPMIGVSYQYRFNHYWVFRADTIFFAPSRLEFAYMQNESLEWYFSLANITTGVFGISYIF